jgi:hypothetical protein
MRSTAAKTASITFARSGSPAPFLRRPVSALGLGPRRPPVTRRVRDLAPGERVPTESRIVFRPSRAPAPR